MHSRQCLYLGEQDAIRAYQIMRDAQPHAWSFDTFQSCLSHPYQAIGLFDHSELQGFYIIYEVTTAEHKEWSLMEIVVNPLQQGQGLGTLLLNDLLSRARRVDVNEIWLEVRASNHNAIHLYRKTGFVQIDVRKNYYPTDDSREDGLVMCHYPLSTSNRNTTTID